MPRIIWIPDFETGVHEIDRQHQRLIILINELFRAMRDGDTRDRISEVISDLQRFADAHFAFEEALMKRYAFPDIVIHRSRHKALADTLKGYRDDFSMCLPSLLELSEFLVDWLTQHMLEPDQRLGVFLNMHGVD